MNLLGRLFRKSKPDPVLEKFRGDVALDVARVKAASDHNRDQALLAIKISSLRQRIANKESFIKKLWGMIEENKQKLGPFASRHNAECLSKISEYESEVRQLQAELAELESGG